MKTKLPKEIKTQKQAQKFLNELHANGESFHPEDSPHDIAWAKDSAPTHQEKKDLSRLMYYVQQFDGFDACEFVLKLNSDE